MLSRVTALTLVTVLLAPAPLLAQVSGSNTSSSTGGNNTPAPRLTSTFTSQGSDIYDVLQLYARHAGIRLYIDPSTPHTAQSYYMPNVSAEEAVQTILQTNGLASVMRDGVLLVGPPSVINARYDAGSMQSVTIPTDGPVTQLASSLQTMLPPGTTVYPEEQLHAVMVIGTATATAAARAFLLPAANVRYENFVPNNGRSAMELIQLYATRYPFSSPNQMLPDTATNNILLRGDPGFLATAVARLQQLDSPVPHIFYDLNFIEMTPEDYSLLRGLQLGTVTSAGVTPGVFSFNNFITKGVLFNATLNAMETKGTAHIFDRTSLYVENGQSGTFNGTKQTPYELANQLTGIPTTNFVTTGVIFTAAPTVSGNVIRTNLTESYSDETGKYVQGIPETETNSVTSVFATTPDEMIILGGMLADTESDSRGGLPPFSNIPLIGFLFRTHSVEQRHIEVVVTMQAHVDYPGNQTVPAAWPSIPHGMIQNGIEPATPPPAQALPVPNATQPAPASTPHS